MIKIVSRWDSSKVLFTSETATTKRQAVLEAIAAGANLAGANLADARNVPAIAAGAGDAPPEPREPYRRATTPEERRERAAARAQRYRELHPEVPVVELLDRKILDVVTGGGGVLDMSDWHHGDACGTRHCRAGWAVTLAGPAGAELERQYGPQRAGAMIYRASTGRVPHFFGPTDRALEDIRRCAEEAAIAPGGGGGDDGGGSACPDPGAGAGEACVAGAARGQQ